MKPEIVWEKNKRFNIDLVLMLIGCLIFACIAIMMYYFNVPINDLYLIMSLIIFTISISIYGTFTIPSYYSLTDIGIHFKYINREKTVYWKDIQEIRDVKIGLFVFNKVAGLILKNEKKIPIGIFLDRYVVEKIWYGYNSYKSKMKRRKQ